MAILNVPGMYLTIQEAVDKALSNDIIIVNKGVYREAIVISKSNLIIMADDDDVILEGNSNKFSVAFTLNECTNVEIRGFNIRNYSVNGILESGGYNNRFIKNIIINSGSQGILFSSSDNLILNNKIINSGSNGIEENSNLLILISNKIIRNLIEKSGGFGILKSDSISSSILDNLVTNNKSSGMQFSNYSADNLIIRNSICDNSNTGIGIPLGVFSYNVIDNKIAKNNNGIELVTFRNVVAYNEIADNLNTGINLSGSLNIVESNHIIKNGQDGISIDGDENLITQNIVVDNEILDIDDNGNDNNFFTNKLNISNNNNIN